VGPLCGGWPEGGRAGASASTPLDLIILLHRLTPEREERRSGIVAVEGEVGSLACFMRGVFLQSVVSFLPPVDVSAEEEANLHDKKGMAA